MNEPFSRIAATGLGLALVGCSGETPLETDLPRRWPRAVFTFGISALLPLAACGNDGTGPGGSPGSQPEVLGLRAGVHTTCAATLTDGRVFCWGANEFGQLGDGTTTDRLRPVPVSGVALFNPPLPGNHACSFEVDGMWCWGRNLSGELGVGTTDPVLTPTLVAGGLVFSEVAVGDDFTCGVASPGVPYCWGANDVGQLGTGTLASSSVPVPVAGNPQFRSIAAGGRTACGATTTNEVLCWGNGADGELGNGQFGVIATTPVAVAGGGQYVLVSIGANAAGQATVCSLAMNGNYCWGKNSDGEVGDGTKVRKNVPTAVLGLPLPAQIAPAGSHTCARVPNADVYCWGKGGRLGTGDSAPSLTPVLVAGYEFEAIWSGRDHTCGWTPDHPSQGHSRQALCWGDNAKGQLGDGTKTSRLAPTPVEFEGS